MLLENPESRFEEIYQIYEEAFPAIERRTRQGQRAVFTHPCYRMRVVEEEGAIRAFLGYWELPGCVFLEHLATAKECRGKGYGRRLVEEVLMQKDKPVFLEIEPITEEEPMTRRRAGFYERLGFAINSFPYLQMPLKPGDEPIPLWVMSHGGSLTEKEFFPYKKEIYETVYKVRL